MGTVIRFPEQLRGGAARKSEGEGTPAAVVILPVVRIERHFEQPFDDGRSGDDAKNGKRRRRRAARS